MRFFEMPRNSDWKVSYALIMFALVSKHFLGILYGSQSGLPYVATCMTSESKSEKILSICTLLFSG